MTDSTLVTAFAEIAKRYPEKVAVVCDGESLTYAELDWRSSGLAEVLALNPAGSAIVAILLDRSVWMAVAMLGVLKAGRAYLPIDAGYPAGRVATMLGDARPEAVVTGRGCLQALAGLSLPMIYIEELPEHLTNSEPARVSGRDDVAYVLYTSGSTGQPKGVQVTHGNVLRLLTATQPWFGFGPDDVWTMFHSFAFDFSVWEMWGPLLTGGRLVIVPFGISRSPEHFHALLREERVTVLNQTPSAFQLLIQSEQRTAFGLLPLPDLRLVIFGGEALQFPALRPWFARHGEGKPQLVNMYGITETTVHVTYRRVRAADALHETDSLIGEPIPDLRLYLLDEHGAEVPDGETGELYVAGAGVARGYLNRPELDAQRFVDDPQVEGARMYRSGDLARRRADGELVYLGRRDGQVKISGFRIELGEVEAALMTVPGVTQVCVQALAGGGGGARLAAYFVSPEKVLTAHEVTERLRAILPSHMVPVFYTQLPEMPLTGNGKIDHEALPAPVTGSGNAALVPASAMEDRVAALWRRVLGAEQVGVEDNFFEIGGSSLLLIAMRSALEGDLQRSIPVTWMFEHTTVRTLAAKLIQGDEPPTEFCQDALREKADRQRGAFARARTARQAGTEQVHG